MSSAEESLLLCFSPTEQHRVPLMSATLIRIPLYPSNLDQSVVPLPQSLPF